MKHCEFRRTELEAKKAKVYVVAQIIAASEATRRFPRSPVGHWRPEEVHKSVMTTLKEDVSEFHRLQVPVAAW